MNMHVYVYMYVRISMWRARSKISTRGCSYSYWLVDYPCIISRIRDYVKIYQAQLTRFQAPLRYGSYQYNQQYSQAGSHGGFLSAGLWDCALAWLWDWSYQLDSMDVFGRMGVFHCFPGCQEQSIKQKQQEIMAQQPLWQWQGWELDGLLWLNLQKLMDFAWFCHVWDFLLVFP